MKDSFILVNLKESKAKQLAQVISNQTSRKILDFLAKKQEATESEIAKALGVPLSTVHYNMKHLKEANLVKVEEFHYSKKGREIDHYKLSNKFVIIAPDETKMDSVKESLSKIWPVALVAAALSGILHIFTRRISGTKSLSAVQEAGPRMMLEDSAAVMPESSVLEPNIALWFLLGSFAALVIYFLVDIIRKRSH